MQNLARFGVGDDGAHWHFENNIVPSSAKHVRAHPMLSTFGLMASGKPKIHQGVEADIGHGIYMPAPSAIPSVGASKFFVLFVTERHAAVAPIACGNVYDGFVNKFHDVCSLFALWYPILHGRCDAHPDFFSGPVIAKNGCGHGKTRRLK